MRLWNPRPEPRDPYDLNHHGLDPVMATAGAIPAIGLTVAAGSFLYAGSEWRENPFNMVNQAWNTAVFAVIVQLGYLLAYVLGSGVLPL